MDEFDIPPNLMILQLRKEYILSRVSNWFVHSISKFASSFSEDKSRLKYEFYKV